MTEGEQTVFDEYGTAYPVCGNCLYATEVAGKIHCLIGNNNDIVSSSIIYDPENKE